MPSLSQQDSDANSYTNAPTTTASNMSNAPAQRIRYDVVVAGAGVAGLLAANVAADRGATVLLLEADRYHVGGNAVYENGELLNFHDSVRARTSLIPYQVRSDALGTNRFFSHQQTQRWAQLKLDAIKEALPALYDTLDAWGIRYQRVPSKGNEVHSGVHTVEIQPWNIAKLSDKYLPKITSAAQHKIFNRVALPHATLRQVAQGGYSGVWNIASRLLRYFFDYPRRLKTPQDRWATGGAALVAQLLQRVAEHPSITLAQYAQLNHVQTSGKRIQAVEFLRGGETITAECDKLILATGDALGDADYAEHFLQDEKLSRLQRQFSVHRHSSHAADALELAELLGARSAQRSGMWETVVAHNPLAYGMEMSTGQSTGTESDAHAPLFMDVSDTLMQPHTACVSHQGRLLSRAWHDQTQHHAYAPPEFDKQYAQFVDMALAQQQSKKQSNPSSNNTPDNPTNSADHAAPAFVVFDHAFRRRTACGTLMPSGLLPDDMLPDTYWGKGLYKADTLAELAQQIGVERTALERAIASHNRVAKSRITTVHTSTTQPQYANNEIETESDTDHALDQNASHDDAPTDSTTLDSTALNWNSERVAEARSHCILTAPYYALPVWPGNSGMKAGVLTSVDGLAMNRKGGKIDGLYAVGACAASAIGSYAHDAVDDAQITALPPQALALTETLTTAYRAALHALDLELS